jgi:antitoxin component YwqK of YwqJK toxin-antitoxin module
MKTKCLIILFIIGLVGCNKNENIEIRRADGTIQFKYKVDQSGKRQGEYLVFFENGIDIFEKSYYQDSLLEGARTLYFKNGQPEIIETYHNGVLEDTVYTYYSNGAIKLKSPYVNGVLEGTLLKYRLDGTILEAVTFVDNQEEGPFKEYYPNGRVKWTGQYLHGNQEFGELIYFDSTGLMLKKMFCDSVGKCRTIWEHSTLPKYD